MKVDGDRIGTARVAFGGMAGTPKRAKTVEEKLRGLLLADTRGWQAAADAIGDDFKPLTDLRASAAYRGRVARNLVIKALAEIAGVSPQVTRVADRRMLADAAE
jgi:xanthine dehydrogenase small subunit